MDYLFLHVRVGAADAVVIVDVLPFPALPNLDLKLWPIDRTALPSPLEIP